MRLYHVMQHQSVDPIHSSFSIQSPSLPSLLSPNHIMSEADRQDMLSMKPIRIGILFNKKKRANLGDVFKSKYKIQHPLTQQSIEVDVILLDDAEHLRAMVSLTRL